MNTQFDLIAWDYDGTLADSRAVAFKRAGDIAALFGLHSTIVTMAQYREVFTRLERDFAREDEHRASLRALHRLLMRADAIQIQPFADVMEIMESLRPQSVIVSAALRDTVFASLGSYRCRFSDVRGAEDGPKEATLSKFAQTKRILYVTDSVIDLRRCAEVAVPAIAVGWGYDSFDELSAARPSWLVRSPSELVGLFTKLNLLKN